MLFFYIVTFYISSLHFKFQENQEAHGDIKNKTALIMQAHWLKKIIDKYFASETLLRSCI